MSFIKKVRRTERVLRKTQILRRILRHCLLIKQPNVIMFYILGFLDVKDVIMMQKTCKYFRLRYLERKSQLNSENMEIRADLCNLSVTGMRNLVSISSYKSIRSLHLCCATKSTLSKLLSEIQNVSLDMSLDLRIQHFLPYSLINNLQIRELLVANTDISTIKELGQMLCHLQSLDLSNTMVTDLESLSLCQKLQKLKLDKISEIQSIDNLPQLLCGTLTNLSLSGTEVSNISILARCTQLQSLNLSYSSVKEISALAGCSMLARLFLAYTDVSDIAALELLPLEVLDLSTTKITQIDNLAKCKTLWKLNLDSTQVSDVNVLKNCRRLHTVLLNFTNVSDVSCLAHVHTLSLANTKVINVDALCNVRDLDLANTEVSDISRLKKVKKLMLNNTRVSDISSLKNVRILDIRGSQVTHIPKLRKIREFFDSVPNNSICNLKRATFIHWDSTFPFPLRDLTKFSKLGWKKIRDPYESQWSRSSESQWKRSLPKKKHM